MRIKIFNLKFFSLNVAQFKILLYLCKILAKTPILGTHLDINDMKDRIKMIMESQKMTQQTFAQFIQISPATLSSIFNGRTSPTLKLVEAIKNKIPNLSTDWLMFGKEPMFLDPSTPSPTLPDPEMKEFTQQFLDFDAPTTPQNIDSEPTIQHGVQNTPIKKAETLVKYVDKPQRQITEIRIFYDDQTWETFVPKKQ